MSFVTAEYAQLRTSAPVDRERQIEKFEMWLIKCFPKHDAGMIVTAEEWGEAVRYLIGEIRTLEADLRSRPASQVS